MTQRVKTPPDIHASYAGFESISATIKCPIEANLKCTLPQGHPISICGIRTDGFFQARAINPSNLREIEFPVAMEEIEMVETDKGLSELKQLAFKASWSVFHPTPTMVKRLEFLNP